MKPKIPTLLFPLVPCFIWLAALAGEISYPALAPKVTTQSRRKILLVDQHGISTGTDKMVCAKHLLNTSFFGTLFNARHLPRTKLFALLNDIQPYTISDSACPRDEEGNKLPQLLIDFLQGARSSKEIRDVIGNHLEISKEYRHHPLRKKILIAATDIMFNPEVIVPTRYFDGDMVQFLRDCAKKLGFEVYMFSNADCESQAIIEQQNPQHFQHPDGTPLYDGKFISGEMGLAKPDPAFYHYALEKIGADPERDFICVIDDQQENTKTATEIGIYGYQWTDNNYKKLENYLIAQQHAHQAQYA